MAFDDLFSQIENPQEKAPQPSGGAFGGLFDKIENPAASYVQESQAKGKPWEEVAGTLKATGVDPEPLRQGYQLQAAKRRAGDRGVSASQVYRSQYQPFGSLVTLPESVVKPLDYVARAVGDKDTPVGGGVVGPREYFNAVEKFKKNQATQEDIEKIATYERMQDARGNFQKNAGFGQKLVASMGSLGTIAAESMTGVGVAGKVGQVTGLAGRAAPVAAAAGATPAVPVAAGLGRQAAGYAASRVLPTLSAPSLYVPMMQESNLRNNRDPNDLRGAPTALGYAYANMLVLGTLSKGAPAGAGQARQAANALGKGVFGLGEMQIADTAAGLLDNVLPKGWEIHPEDQRYGTAGNITRAFMSKDGSKVKEALGETAIQALSFAAFARLHGTEAPEPKTLLSEYLKGRDALVKSGLTKPEAENRIAALHDSLEESLSANPYLSREEARVAIDKAAVPELKEYGKTLADVFTPKDKLPTPPEPTKDVAAAATEPATKATPEVKADKSGQNRTAPEVPAKTALPKPVAEQAGTKEPAAVADSDERYKPFQPTIQALVAGGMTAEQARAQIRQMFPKVFADPGVDIQNLKTAPPGETLRAKVDRLTELQRANDKKLQAEHEARVRKGNNPEHSRKEMHKESREFLRQIGLEEARNELMKHATEAAKKPEPSPTPAPSDMPAPNSPEALAAAASEPAEPARQPNETAATPSEAPSVAPVASAEPAATPAPSEPSSPPASDARSRRQEMRESINAAATKAPSPAEQLKSKYAEMVKAHGLTADVESGHIERLHRLVEKMPARAVELVNQNLKAVHAYDGIRTMTEGILKAVYAEALRTNNRQEMLWAKQAHEDLRKGLLSMGGAVHEPTGKLYIDGGGKLSGTPDRGRLAIGEHARAEELLAHETGHMVDWADGKRLSDSPEWAEIHQTEMHSGPGEQAPISEYAETLPKESFAEFWRLVYESDIGHAGIAKAFPKAAEFLKSRGLWPEAERDGKPVEPLKEIYNEGVNLADGTHADGWNIIVDTSRRIPDAAAHREAMVDAKATYDMVHEMGAKSEEHARNAARQIYAQHSERYFKKNPDPTVVSREDKPAERVTSLTPEEKPAEKPKPKAGSRKKAAKPQPNDRERISAEAAKLPEGSEARDALEGVAHNLADGDLSPELRRRDTVAELSAAFHYAWKTGDPQSLATLGRLIEEFGGKIGEAGKTVDYDGKLYGSLPGVGQGDRVLVTRPPVTIPEGDGPFVARKGEVEPLAAAATAKAGDSKKEKLHAALREQWNDMSPAERKALSEDEKAMYAEAGVDVKDLKGKKRVVNSGDSVAAHAAVSDRVKAAEYLSTVEKAATDAVLRGESLRDAGKRVGMSQEGIRKAAARALEKLKARDTFFSDFTTLEDFIQKSAAAARLYAAERQAEQEGRDFQKDVDRELDGEADFFGNKIRVKDLADVVRGKPGAWKELRSKLDRTIFGNLPPEARAGQRQMEAQVARFVYEMSTNLADLKRALAAEGKDYRKMTGVDLAKLDDVLRVPPEQTLAAAAREGFSKETAAVLETMRRHLDVLSDQLIEIGAIPDHLVATVEENKGVYLTRQYRIFDKELGPKWAEEVPEEVRNKMKALLVEQIAGTEGIEAATAERLEGEIKRLLYDATAAGGPIEWIKRGKLGSQDLSILKDRNTLPPELRALWGEYRDPVANYAVSVGKMTHLLSARTFLNRMAQEGLGKFLFENVEAAQRAMPDAKGFVKIAPEANEAMTPLSGLITTPEIKRGFEEGFSQPMIGPAVKGYMKLVAAMKFSKVVANHAGIARNFLSNLGFAVRGGYFRVGHIPAALRAIWLDTPEARQRWQKYIGLRIVGENLTYRDFQGAYRAAFEDVAKDYRGPTGRGNVEPLFTHLWKTGVERLSKLYHYGDALFKVYAFENEKARYMEAGLSEAEAEQRAADIVTKTTPTYSEVPELLKKTRYLPTGPFVSFVSEVYRTTWNTAKLGWAEYKDPRTRAIGATRLAGLAASMTLPAAAATAIRMMLGIQKDQEDALRRFVPEYQKHSTFLFTGRDEKGVPTYVDLSRTDPMAAITDPAGVFVSMLHGKDAGLADLAEEITKPYTSEEPVTRAALDIARNQKEPGGRVYNPSDAGWSKTADVLTHAATPLVPGGVGPARRMAMALAGSREQKSGQGYGVGAEAVENTFGQRQMTTDLEYGMSNKVKGYLESKNQATSIVNQMREAKGVVSQADLKSAYERTEAGRQQALEELKRDVDDAQKLGVEKKVIFKILKAGGVPQEDINTIFLGSPRRPYMPEFKGSLQERERTRDVRKLAGSR